MMFFVEMNKGDLFLKNSLKRFRNLVGGDNNLVKTCCLALLHAEGFDTYSHHPLNKQTVISYIVLQVSTCV